MDDGRPFVLIVDDEPELQTLLAAALDGPAECEVREPWLVEKHDLEGSDLVLIDLTLQNMPPVPEDLPLMHRPADGLGLTGVLRSHLPQKQSDLEQRGHANPTAFALHTSHLDRLVPHLPPDVGEHVAARLNNLEWAFRKTEQGAIVGEERGSDTAISLESLLHGPSKVERILALASATSSLQTQWNQGTFDDASAMLRGLLGLGDENWELGAENHARGCRPPLFEVAADSGGLAFMRWMLHRVLPYPCFLIDSHYLALKLGVTRESLAGELTRNAEFSGLLDRVRYRGLLADFTGPRWWRVGIDAVVYELTGGNIFDRDTLRRELVSAAGDGLEFLSDNCVLCIGPNYQPVAIRDRSQVVRVQPDDWPPFAEQAYAAIADASTDSRLERIVVFDDIALLEPE